MTDDAELLRRYAEHESEEAFAELVRRHLDLVYSAALRQVGGDAHRAADVAQTVFIALARKAGGLASHTSLAGWLYTSTRYAACEASSSNWSCSEPSMRHQSFRRGHDQFGSAPPFEVASDLDSAQIRRFVLPQENLARQSRNQRLLRNAS